MSIKSIRELCNSNSIIYDLKHIFDPAETDLRL